MTQARTIKWASLCTLCRLSPCAADFKIYAFKTGQAARLCMTQARTIKWASLCTLCRLSHCAVDNETYACKMGQAARLLRASPNPNCQPGRICMTQERTIE